MCRYETLVIKEYDEMTLEKETASCFKFDFSGGIEYDIAKNISLGLELKYDIITDGYSQFVAIIGAKYKF